MIRQEVKVGEKFQIGEGSIPGLRVLTVTSISPLGVLFDVSPKTFHSNQKQMFMHFTDRGFWDSIKPYKEKIVHKADVIWYRFNPQPGVGVDNTVHRYIYRHGQVLGGHVTELKRTTVEYTEER